MAVEDTHAEPPSKRRKFDPRSAPDARSELAPSDGQRTHSRSSNSNGLDKPISPPLSRRLRSRTPTPSTPRLEANAARKERESSPAAGANPTGNEEAGGTARYIRSPFQLTQIKDLAPHQNVDTVELTDILGDPMIKECWNFNYLFNLDFVMQHFDPDVRNLVKVKIVHGFWKREDQRRIALMEAAEPYPNIDLISAYIPDPFGTHHSKMLVLFRHDDLAQVVIHTANMIPRDWGNMTQAVWQSPLLPLKSPAPVALDSASETQAPLIGTGERFKIDLLHYLGAYGKRLNGLPQQLDNYDFSSIQAAFIGSAPSRQQTSAASPTVQTSFGWLGLQEILSTVPVRGPECANSPPNIVAQVSSIATLGQNPTWLTHFQSILSRKLSSDVRSAAAVNFFTKTSSKFPTAPQSPNPTLNIIFPTPDEIRTSLDGYNSGGSIHTKIQSAAQQKQLEYLRPLFCHWKTSEEIPPEPASALTRGEAYRGPAAPHIKTYFRFSDDRRKSVDWAMVTSANLSKQAWGEMENKKGEVWIQSWEAGVVVWPRLFADSADAVMVPTFGKDIAQSTDGGGYSSVAEKGPEDRVRTVIALRMPYSLPLRPYAADEVPWCASLAHAEPDWKGQIWPGY